MPRITLWGFLQYDKTLFDGLDLPTGCDPEILKDTIIMESGDLFPYYQHPGYLKANIRTWFRRMLPQFQKSFDALALEYVANENYDRYEDYSDTFNKESSDKRETGETTPIFTESAPVCVFLAICRRIYGIPIMLRVSIFTTPI